jgi:hypothetical protein
MSTSPTTHRRLGRPPTGRELPGRDCAHVPAPRSGCHLRRRVRTPGERPGDARDPHRPSRPLAESLRRARHRIDSTGMPRSHHCDQRTASPTSAAQLSRVLQRHPPASVPPQQQPQSAQSANVSGRGHRRDSAGRRTSSPLSARRLSTAVARHDGQEMPVVLCPFAVRPVCPLDATVARRLAWRNRLGLHADARGVRRGRRRSANEVCDRRTPAGRVRGGARRRGGPHDGSHGWNSWSGHGAGACGRMPPSSPKPIPSPRHTITCRSKRFLVRTISSRDRYPTRPHAARWNTDSG